MKRILTLLVAALALSLFSASAQQFEGLSLENYSFSKVRPSGTRSMTGVLQFTMNNSGERRALSQIKVVAYRKGKAFLQGTGSDLTFERGRGDYTLHCKVKLARGVNVWEAAAALKSFDPAQYTLNVSLVMTHEDGTAEEIVRKNLPVTKFAPKK